MSRVLRGMVAAAVMGLAGWAGGQGARAAEAQPLVIGAGEAGGLFLPEAAAICRLLGRDRARGGLRCLVEASTGSAANLEALRGGDQHLAIVQSKLLAQAVAGSGPFDKHPFPELRSLLSLHGESLVVLLAPHLAVKSMADLKGKRLGLGRPGGFQRSLADAVLAAEGFKPGDFSPVLEQEAPRLAKALCAGQIDAALFAGLHPLAEVQEAMDDCGATLLPLKDAAVEGLAKADPAFALLSLPAGAYQGQSGRLPTIGLRAVLATTSRLSEDQAYAVVKAVFGGLGPFKEMHPILAGLERKQMARDGLAAPLHDGAKRYYRENGLP